MICGPPGARAESAGALKRPGVVTGIFLIGYGIARTTCEFFREPDVQLGFLWSSGWLTIGMLLCIPLILAGIVLLAFVIRSKPVMRRKPIVKDG